MAENRQLKSNLLSSQVINELKKLVWGSRLREDVFNRWSQGFVFSDKEPTALVQCEGGPCAVIAPVQAFLLRNAVFRDDGDWRQVTAEQNCSFLLAAFRDIMAQCATSGSVVAFLGANRSDEEGGEERRNDDETNSGPSTDLIENEGKTEEAHFHSQLRVVEVGNGDDLEQILKDKLEFFKDIFGVILFFYSVLLTKGLDQVKNEMEDPNEPLIDEIHGHGSQSLINLLLSGRAVSNVWDNDKDVSGLKLQGINKQPLVGFLTLLEHLRYCEVGWFLKCPQFPIWVLGSETHLTVLFSKERKLCTPETPEATAKRVFKSFDPEGNNFISSILLADVLKALDLFSDPEYVEVVKRKLDSEELGIILLTSFMDEFYPSEETVEPESFVLYHYNGLCRSCPGEKVVYRDGRATLVDFEVKMYSENSPILTCLQTKWPGLEVEWSSDGIPSLN